MLQHTSRYRRVAFGLATLGAGVGLLVGALPGTAGADGPAHVSGNPKCSDLGFDNGFKIDKGNPEAGTYKAGDPGTETEGDASGFEATISYSAFPVFDFTTNIAVNAVLVKAGPGGNLYTYDPGVTSGSGLDSPKDSISHITFCWGGDGPPGEEPPGEEPPGEEPPGEEPPGEKPDDKGPKPGEPAPPVAGEPGFTG